MIAVVSPAKSLDMTPAQPSIYTKPALSTQANQLAKILRDKTAADLKALMKISDKLSEENYKRYQDYRTRVSVKNAKRAVDTFAGDVYRGLNAADFDEGDYEFAQEHLRILSGLYGILRPLDLMQPYRLEMGTKLPNDKGSNLYHFWEQQISQQLNKQLKALSSDTLINLASDEYFKSVDKKALNAKIITINFKEWRDDQLKFISFSAKVARGLMARYMIKHRINQPEDLKGFDTDGYGFSPEHSTDDFWLFVR